MTQRTTRRSGLLATEVTRYKTRMMRDVERRYQRDIDAILAWTVNTFPNDEAAAEQLHISRQTYSSWLRFRCINKNIPYSRVDLAEAP